MSNPSIMAVQIQKFVNKTKDIHSMYIASPPSEIELMLAMREELKKINPNFTVYLSVELLDFLEGYFTRHGCTDFEADKYEILSLADMEVCFRLVLWSWLNFDLILTQFWLTFTQLIIWPFLGVKYFFLQLDQVGPVTLTWSAVYQIDLPTTSLTLFSCQIQQTLRLLNKTHFASLYQTFSTSYFI